MKSAEGDIAGAFSRMYENHYAHVHAYAARRVGKDAADEIAAETFLIAWRRFNELPERSLPWLYGVARHIVLQHRAALARQELIRKSLEFEPAAGHEGEDSVLWDAWQQLSHRDREVLALVAWEQLPIRDAARVLDCSPSTFSVRLHRARRRLERRLKRSHSGIDPTPILSEVR
jgi:RNA polymerase sigma-70 factor (ECF subfamily)